MTDLDRIDYEILAALQNDARLSNKALARKVGLAPSSCLARVRALQQAGVLMGQHVEIRTSALGIGLEALIAIRLVRHSSEAFKRLYAHLLAMPEVLTVFHVSGVNDLQVHVAVRDVQHLRDMIVEKIASRAEVDHCDTSVIFTLHRKHEWPNYVRMAAEARGKATAARRG